MSALRRAIVRAVARCRYLSGVLLSFCRCIVRCARAVHKICIVPYPNCIVVPSINNNEPREYWVRSPSSPPSPSQPGRSLLASLEAKRRDPLPSQRSNTPSMSVSQPCTATRPARSPLALTASSPSLPAQRTSHWRSAPGLGHSRSRGRSRSRSTSKLRPKKRARSEDYGTLPSEREGAQHYRLIDPLHSGSLFPLFWLPLLPSCAPPPCLLCSPLSLLVWLPPSVCLCCSSPCLLALLGARVAHPLLPHPPAPPWEDFTSRGRISPLRTTWTVPCVVGWSRPCCHPRGGHFPARGAQPPPLWSTWAPCTPPPPGRSINGMEFLE